MEGGLITAIPTPGGRTAWMDDCCTPQQGRAETAIFDAQSAPGKSSVR